MIKQEDNLPTSIIERDLRLQAAAHVELLAYWSSPYPLQTQPIKPSEKSSVLPFSHRMRFPPPPMPHRKFWGLLPPQERLHLDIYFPSPLPLLRLLAIVTISYEQTIHAYPGGGGAYIVARDNLGEFPAQTAGAALLTDYILTVSVSVSAGVAQIVSAYPACSPTGFGSL